jgi:hemolysin III
MRRAPTCHDGYVTGEVPAQRPLLRGWSHALAIVPAVIGATVLVVSAHDSAIKRLSLVVYGIGLTLLFTISTLYHRGPWSPRVLAVWRRLDHASIFVMIAATYTPVIVVVLGGWMRIAMLAGIWVLTAAGALIVTTRVTVPRYALVLLYVAVGWSALVALPAMAARLGPSGMAYILAGGALYSLGALAYALRRPRLWPSVFGYHEVFHILVIAATAVFFAFIAGRIVPYAHI